MSTPKAEWGEGITLGIAIIADENGAVFICTTSGTAFGPVVPDRDIAEAFLRWIGEPRNYDDGALLNKWATFRDTRLTGPCGHFGKADVMNYSDRTTVFSCMQKECKAVWDLQGEPIANCSVCGDQFSGVNGPCPEHAVAKAYGEE